MKFTIRFKGGKGSGHHGHEGRPGMVGGSTSGRGGTSIGTLGTSIGSGGKLYNASEVVGDDVGGGYSVSKVAGTPGGYNISLSGSNGSQLVFSKVKPVTRGAPTKFILEDATAGVNKSWNDSDGLASEKIAKYMSKKYGIDYSSFPIPRYGTGPDGKTVFGVVFGE